MRNNIKRIGVIFIIAMVMTLIQVFSISALAADTVPLGYKGIYTASDLNNVRNNLNGKYILMSNIYLFGLNWIPIGAIGNNGDSISLSIMFNGVFDGGNHIIFGLNINRSISGQVLAGLFAYNNGTIKNLQISGSVRGINTSTGTGSAYSGGFAGINDGIISNCKNTAKIYGSTSNSTLGSSVGGIAGSNAENGEIINCSNIGSISSDRLAGGIASRQGGIIGSCFNSGSVSSLDRYAGGIAAGSYDNSIIRNCYNIGAIYAANMSAGGILGSDDFGSGFAKAQILNCYNAGNVTAGISTSTGGIAGSGRSSSTITVVNSYCLNLYNGSYGTALTSNQMRQRSSFVGFDFGSVWNINSDVNSGYPYLRALTQIGDYNGSSLLEELRNKFPQNKFWNHVGMTGNNEDGYTDKACPSHAKDKVTGTGTATCNHFTAGTGKYTPGTNAQCYGFANKLQFDLYGSDQTYNTIYNLDNIKVGDHIRFGGHSVLVVAVSADKKTLTVGECNWATSSMYCVIDWTRKVTKNSITNKGLDFVKSAPYEVAPLAGIKGTMLLIACPVDIEIYDSYGILTGKVVNNVIDYSIPAPYSIAIIVENDIKTIWLGSSEDYTLKLMGTDMGTMDFEVFDMDFGTDTIIGTKSFNNITLTDNKQITTTIFGDKFADDARLYGVDNKKIVSEINVDGTETTVNDKKYIISTVVSGYGSATGGGIFNENDIVNLVAYPGIAYPDIEYIFDGWYENGIKIESAGEIYSFTVTTGRTLEARFIPDYELLIAAVAADKAALTWNVIKGANTAANNVTVNLGILPLSGANDTTITWASNNTSAISNNGTVTRPAYGSGDATVTLTATISKGTASDTVVFMLTVKELPQSDAAAVSADKAALTWNVIKGANTAANNVTVNLGILPLSGANDTTITWASNNTSAISNKGTVTRPAYGSGDVAVTLTATISKGTASDTVAFTLIVKSLPQDENNGCSLSGKVISVTGDVRPATVTLKQNGNTVYTTQTNQNGEYVFNNVVTGNYSLVITKASYLSYTKTSLAVSNQNISYKNVTLIPGDIDGDGHVSYNDFLKFLENYNKQGANIVNKAADINGDGYVDYNDFITFLSGYGKAAIVE